MKNSILMLIVLGFIAFACNKEPIGQQPIDSVPPGVITNVKVENTPGGAILTYTIPQDEDLLYVKAVYSLKDGVPSEVRSSLYSDTLKVAGFGDTQERQVKLIAVDRSRNESVPVTTTITPLEPPVTTIGNTLNLVQDFGGVHGLWDNPTRAEVSVVILQEDNNKEYVPVQTFYSTMANGECAQRGMDTIPANFGIYVQDRWENRSEIKYFTLTPIYETKFDRLKFKEVVLPGDEPGAWGWFLPNIWDGKILGWGVGYSSPGGTGRWPHSITMDLGVTGKISRLVLFQRGDGPTYIFAEGNPRNFEVWGCQTIDPTGNWASWTKLMDCTSIKPSGLPYGKTSNEDVDRAIVSGETFVCSPLNPRVRYLRIRVTKSWSGGDNFQIGELEIYGDNR